MRKDFYIFRHGETELNLQKRIQGSGKDVALNEKGIRQAEGLITKFADIPLEIIFSSPLQRAKQTAETMAATKKIPVIEKQNLRECYYGDAEGMLIAEAKEKFAEVIDNWSNPKVWEIAYPRGESKKDALERVWRQIEELCGEPYNVMGIAIHGGTMSSLLNYLHFDFEKIENCAVFHLVYENGNWFVDGNLF